VDNDDCAPGLARVPHSTYRADLDHVELACRVDDSIAYGQLAAGS
jgi:hypothetical protein